MLCQIRVPYSRNAGFAFTALLRNQSGNTADTIGSVPISAANDTGTSDNTTWALFSLSPPEVVPEPASWAMLITGFGLTGALARRRRALA